VLWETYRRHYGPDGDSEILVAKGTSRDFNPDLSQKFIHRALERDPEANRAEYLAEFRTDVESLLTIEATAGALVLAYLGSSYSQRQAFKDNLKMAEVYKKGSRPTSLRGLLANLPAYVVFLLVERLLLQRSNVPAILARHVPFFLADLAIFPVKLVCLPLDNVAFLKLVFACFGSADDRLPAPVADDFVPSSPRSRRWRRLPRNLFPGRQRSKVIRIP
jgi:hypothetical protein